MGGEKPKKIGEEGEKIARHFIDNLGWLIAEENYDIPCEDPATHEGRANHGVDFIVAYDCPLSPSIRQNVLISMKNSHSEKTSGESSSVRDNLTELDCAIECFKRSRVAHSINRDSSRPQTTYSGILIKINKDQDAAESFLRNLSRRARIETPHKNQLHFIENKRFDLVDVALNHLKSSRYEGETSYFYPSNNQTYAADVAEVEGKLIPIQHLIASPLTFKYVEGNLKEFIVFSSSAFDISALERLVGLAYGCSEGWAGKITIIFPNLSMEQKTQATTSLRGIRSQRVAASVNVESFDIRSRLNE